MKTLFITAIVLISFMAQGQIYSRHDNNTNLDKGFEAKISLGYGIGVGEYNYNIMRVDVVSGYRFSPYFSSGIGTGLTFQFENNYYFMPIYLNLQTNLNKRKSSPYIGADIGFSLGKNESNKIKNAGFYLNPMVGVNIKLSNDIALNLGLSYRFQWMNIDDFYSTDEVILLKSPTMIVGINF